jgi:hypothetical protein
MTSGICFCWTCAGASFSLLHPNGGCDHYDYALSVVIRLCRDLDLLLEFYPLAVEPLLLGLMI